MEEWNTQMRLIDQQRTAAVQLSDGEMTRYSRHLLMPEVTAEGQRRLKAAREPAFRVCGRGSAPAAAARHKTFESSAALHPPIG
jgi:hypothetical protein